MTDDERRRQTARLLSRHHRREGLLWSSVVLAVAGLAAGIPAITLLSGTGSTLAILTVVLSGTWLCFGAWLAPLYSANVRRLRRDLAGMRSAGEREGRPAPKGLLEVAWRPEGHGLLLWNGLEAAALAGPGLAGIVWPDGEPPTGPGWARQLRGSATPYQWMLLDGREYVVLPGWWQLIDPHGRAWALPRPGTVEHGYVVRVPMPGELGPLGAVAVFVLATRLHAYAQQAQALR